MTLQDVAKEFVPLAVQQYEDGLITEGEMLLLLSDEIYRRVREIYVREAQDAERLAEQAS